MACRTSKSLQTSILGTALRCPFVPIDDRLVDLFGLHVQSAVASVT